MDDELELQEAKAEPEELPVTPREPGIRRLRRSRKNRMIAGVAGGIGQYFGIDPILIRLAFVALTLGVGSGILFYIVAWILMPEATDEEEVATAPGSTGAGLIVGAALIVVGAMLLFRQLVPWFDDQVFWALVLIVMGAGVILYGTRRRAAL